MQIYLCIAYTCTRTARGFLKQIYSFVKLSQIEVTYYAQHILPGAYMYLPHLSKPRPFMD